MQKLILTLRNRRWMDVEWTLSEWTGDPFDGRHGGVADQGVAVPQAVDVQLALHREEKRVGVEENLQLCDLEVAVDGDATEAEHLYDLALAFAAFVSAGEGSEMSPGEDDVRRSAQDF